MTEQEAKQIEESIKAAAATNALMQADIRPPIKQKADSAKIAVCIPMGDKDDPDVLVCEHCSKRHVGVAICPGCGKEHETRRKARHAGLVPIEWLLNAWQIVPPLLCSLQVMVRKSTLSAQGRNEMTYQAIKDGAKYIFYWDDDTIIPPKAIYDLHNMMERYPDVGVISGVYTTREELPEPLIYKKHGQGAYWNFDPYTPGVLEPIFGAGAGCMMARVSALKEVEQILGGPWWADEQDLKMTEEGRGKATWGHDIRFCKRMWATHQMDEVGYPTPGPDGVEDPRKKPSEKWKVMVAGWIRCYHWDIARQRAFAMPVDAPCFKNVNTDHYWSHIWGSEGHDTWRQYPEMFSKVASLIPKGSNVVDVGCGVGILMDRLEKERDAKTYGYDISTKAIELLHDIGKKGKVQDVIDFKLNHFPTKETVVVSTESIEHMDDKRLDRLFSESAKGKKAIFTTPKGKLEGTPPGEHVQVWQPLTLRNRLKQHFSNVQINELETVDRPNNPFLIAVCSNEHRSILKKKVKTKKG